MFFRSKSNKEAAKPEREPAPPERSSALPAQAATGASIEPAASSAPVADKSLPPEELKKRAEVSQRLATAVGEIVILMVRSPRHGDHKLSDLRWKVLPAVRTGQYALIKAQSKSHGLTAPVAAVLWARVSAEVDQRLSDKLDEPIRLGPREWKSGDIVWLVDAIGDDRGIAALVQRLRASEWKDKPVKARVTDADGHVKVRVIEPQAMPNGAARAN
jgi:hemolysin-activating ACP:hemolysin acyltransferase